jgi:hypothetical protein
MATDGYREVLLGCGFETERRLDPATLLGDRLSIVARDVPERARGVWARVTTVDINPLCKPDIVQDLDVPKWRSLPSESADEVHAYEVLEHLGRQGDVCSFFATFNEIYRLLQPEGLLCATVPRFDSQWAWGDPGHRRVITLGSLSFLDRVLHRENIARGVSSDYRHLSHCDFVCLGGGTFSNDQWWFILEAVKPVRPW